MRFDRVLVVMAVVLAGFVPAVFSTGFGVNAHIPADRVADRIDEAGIEWVRIDVLWSFVEPERDVYDWSIYDALVDRLEARGLRIFAGLGATPQWATGGSDFSGVPDDVAQWREFCYLASKRYAGRIRAWGVWNEPNLDRFWEGSRQEYIDVILLPGAQAIRLGDPSALIGAPDLAHLSSADWDDWLRATINAGSDFLDVVTHHVYPSDGWAWQVTYDLETGGPFPFSPPSVQSVLQDTDWWRRPFWLTETGVESNRWGDGRQANFVADFLVEWFAPTRGHRSWVDRLFFYEMNDAPDPTVHTFGLVHGPPDLDPKPAYIAYGDFIAGSEVDDSELVDSDVPHFLQSGQIERATITVRNSGTTSWSQIDSIRLAVEIDSPGWLVEVEQLDGDDLVAPGEIHAFPIIIHSPGILTKEIGSEPVLSARMEREATWPFGDLLRQEIVIAHDPPPKIVLQPVSGWVVDGQSLSLWIDAEGSQPLMYRWLRNGTQLVDGELYSGSQSPVLTVTALSHEVAAFYQCVVSNDVGAVVSDAAAVMIGNSEPRPVGGRVTPDEDPPSPSPAREPPRLTGPPEHP